MEHALLTSFLEGRTPPAIFARAIEQEVSACETGLRSPAKVGYILITDGPQFIITREHMKRLLHCLLDETIPWLSVNYTGDCMMMSSDFEPADDVVEQAIDFVADDSRLPTGEETRAALDALG